MAGLTDRAAKFIVETSFSDIPDSAVKVAKNAILDCCGVTVAALKDPVAQIILDYSVDRLGPPSATIFGSGIKTSSEDAAFANSVLAHALDYDDVHVVCGGHVSSVLVPAILALGEELGASGDKIVSAYCIGFELIYRLGQQMASQSIPLGFHTTGLWGPVGTAAAAASLLGLDADQARMALAIAASSSAGLAGNFGTMTKGYHSGNGARAGLAAAKLAQKGFTGSPDILERDRGFIGTFSQAPVAPDAMDTLGDVYALSQGVEFKLYPSCGKTQSAIDSALRLVTEHDLAADDIEQIVCEASDLLPRIALIHQNPVNGLQAKFSMQYVIATVILDRAAGLAQFADEAVLRPEIQALMRKFTYVHPEELRGHAGFMKNEKITLRLRDGREVSHHENRADGVLGGTVTTENLIEKYRNCLNDVLSPATIDRTLTLICDLEKLENVGELTALLGGAAADMRHTARPMSSTLLPERG